MVAEVLDVLRELNAKHAETAHLQTLRSALSSFFQQGSTLTRLDLGGLRDICIHTGMIPAADVNTPQVWVAQWSNDVLPTFFQQLIAGGGGGGDGGGAAGSGGGGGFLSGAAPTAAAPPGAAPPGPLLPAPQLPGNTALGASGSDATKTGGIFM